MRRWLPLLPALAWAAFLLWLGSQPIQGPSSDLPLDKVAHLGLYGTLGALAAWGSRRAGAGRAASIAIVVACMAVGVADELDQRRVVERTADPLDWVADAVGITLAFGAVRHFERDAGERRSA